MDESDPGLPEISHRRPVCTLRLPPAGQPRRLVSSAMSAASQKLLGLGTKIVAVGRNYAAHAKELGNAVPKEPVLFLKPTSSYLPNGGTIEIPHPLDSLDHEVELAVVVGRKARDVPEASAMDYVGGYALALDMTAREIQSNAKSAGLPWTLAKGQDTFTPISDVIGTLIQIGFKGSFDLNSLDMNVDSMAFKNQKRIDPSMPKQLAFELIKKLPKSMIKDPHNLELWLKVDNVIRQKGSTCDIIFKLPFLISYISSIMTLFEGDVILTGTPQGVGPVKAGQKITAGITDHIDAHFNIQKRRGPSYG